MLDFDLAEMYGIENRVLKQAVRRNLKRFEGEDFMFELTRDELSRSHIVTLNKGRGSNFKYMPFAFTELGVAMLSSVLNSDTAIGINTKREQDPSQPQLVEANEQALSLVVKNMSTGEAKAVYKNSTLDLRQY